MKKVILIMFLLGTLISANAQVPNYVPTSGLVGWYPFNGNANDESGNNLDGVVYGASLANDRFGNANKSYSFNGTSNYIEVADNSLLDITGSVTISCWIQKPQFNNRYEACVIKEELGNANYKLQINKNNEMSFYTSRGYAASAFSSSSWHNFISVCRYDSIFIYLDGVMVWNTINQVNSNNLTNNNLPLTFGRLTYDDVKEPGNQRMYFNGKLDDIGIWNRALTPSEVKDLYNGCKLAISTEPTNQSSDINNQVQFTSLASDTTASYQWQSNQSSLGWVNVPANSVYSGVATKKLNVNNIQVNNHKQLFRVIAAKNTCKDTSVVAMLTVNDTCINSTTDTLYIKVNTSSLSNPVYNTIKVYSNPSSTQVIIDNGNYSTMGSYTAKIVNASGQSVFQSVINQQQFVIDANTMGGAGVYTLYITDSNNNVVGLKKIVLQ